MTSRTRLRRALVAVLAASSALLAGCAGIPTSGPIEQGDVVAPPGSDSFVRVIAREPVPGMSPEEVVRGFQEATASQEPGFTVAKKYLTPLAAATWKPERGVKVYDNSGLAYEQRGDVVAASGGLSGDIDGEGQWTIAPPGSRLDVRYGLARVDGEWRISAPPQGLVLGRADIDRSYRAFDLYYFTKDFLVLVPAPVTVPLTEAGLATTLVQSLLEGPTPWIAPSVATGFPVGTRLATTSVPVVDGVAEVALSPEAALADDAGRQALSAQLVWTLRQLPEVTAVRITVGGQPFSVPGVGSVQSVDSWSSYDPDGVPETFTAYAIDERGLLRMSPDFRLSVQSELRPAGILPAVSLDATRLAALTSNRAQLWEYPLPAESDGTRRYSGVALSRPSFDRTGGLWVVDQGKGLRLVEGAKSREVPVVGLPEDVAAADISAASVSRDGTRIALLVQRGSRIEPMVARIERSGDVVRVAAPRRVDSLLTDSLDLAWADSGTLVVLGSSGTSSLEVWRFGVGTTSVRRVGAPDGALTVAAGPNRSVLVGTDDSLYRASGQGWTLVGAASYPVYPG
jgi:hypothetical protein